MTQGVIALLSLIGTGYINGIPSNSSRAFVVDAGIGAFYASAWLLRRVRPRSRPVLEYARRAYRLLQWTFTVVAAAIAPSVLPLIPFLGKLNDLKQNVALVIGVLVFLALLGNITAFANIFKNWEDDMVKKFEAENPPSNGIDSD